MRSTPASATPHATATPYASDVPTTRVDSVGLLEQSGLLDANPGDDARASSQALAAKADLLDLLLNATQDGVLDWDLTTNAVSCNARWKYLLGFDDADDPEFSGQPDQWRNLLHPEDLTATNEALWDHLECGWPFVTTVRMRHRHAGYRYVLCRGAAHRDADDRPRRMLIIFADIDDQIRAQERQRALVAALPDTLFGIRADGMVLGVKHGTERDGSAFATLREGTTLAECLTDERARQAIEEAIAPSSPPVLGSVRPPVELVSATNPPIHHDVRVVPSGDDEWVCIVRDVTDQRELEQRLLQSQKMQAIGHLAAGVAHEINTPMQFIGDNLHFVRESADGLLRLVEAFVACVDRAAAGGVLPTDDLSDVDRAKNEADLDFVRDALPTAIERSLAGVERVTKIVRAMKTFAHPGGEDLAPTDLNAIVESTSVVATNEWKYVADLELELDASLPAVPCIAGELSQVVLNLIINASHAIVDVVGNSGEKGIIRISTSAGPDHAEIRVGDTGTGIPEAVRAKIFDPFFTTKDVGRGTGQGLALAHSSIVDRHRGTIHFETDLGRGTTFVIRLPLSR